MSRHAVGIAALLLGSCLAFPGFAEARDQDAKASRLEGNPNLAKVSSHLLGARRLASEGAPLSRIRAVHPILRLRDDRPEVEIQLRTLTPVIVARIKELGMHITGVHYEYARIVGECDLAQLDEIAAIPEVATIQPNYGTWASAGAVKSQGDVSLRADEARAAFGVDGTGVQVGILADSFYGHGIGGGTVAGTGCSRTLMGSSPQLSGDLPAAVTVLDNCASGGSSCSFVVDEGAAIAETVHDVAPGAAILFHSAFNSEADFAQGISELRACGADVLIDDALWLAEPMFQDGIVAQAVQSAVNAGVSYFSAAGNEAAFGIDEVYVDAVPATDDLTSPPTGRDLHDFGSNNRFGKIVIPDGCGVLLVLQWNQPYSGTLGPGASNDLDLYLCSSDSLALDPGGSLFGCNGNGALAVGDDGQSCGGAEPPSGNPFEILLYVNTTGASVDTYLAVEHYCGSQSGVRFRVASFGVNCDLTTPGYSFENPGIFDQSSMYGHPTAAGANAVGSVFYGEIESRGSVVAPTGAVDVNPSSSIGGNIPFYFDGSGNPLPGAPVTRFKPQFVAPDGANTTFFSFDIAYDADTFPNFFGTSAAAAHAAAVAALLLDGEPSLTPQQVRDRLSSTAVDLEAPGVDATAGAGLIQAYFAVGNIACNQLSPSEVLNLGLARTTPGGSTARLSWSPTPAASSYNVYRGTQKNLSDLSCFLPGVGTNEAIDAAVPGASQVLYYLVTARNCAGESTLGTMKPAAPRPAPPPVHRTFLPGHVYTG